jgi:hypothetical protein
LVEGVCVVDFVVDVPPVPDDWDDDDWDDAACVVDFL